jgi:hypothetical protein
VFGNAPNIAPNMRALCQRRDTVTGYNEHVGAHQIPLTGMFCGVLDRLLREECNMLGEVHKALNMSGEASNTPHRTRYLERLHSISERAIGDEQSHLLTDDGSH